MASVKLSLRIILRPSFPSKREIVLTGDVSNIADLPVDVLSQLAFDIETILNERIPQIRVHSSIDVDSNPEPYKEA